MAHSARFHHSIDPLRGCLPNELNDLADEPLRGGRVMRTEIAKMTYQFPITVIQLRITEAVPTR